MGSRKISRFLRDLWNAVQLIFDCRMASLKCRQFVVCALTGCSYICIYLLRKPLGVVKTDLQKSYHLTKNELGWLDTSFFLPYALTQILFGNIGDKYGARATIVFNLVLSSLSMISFGFWNSPYILSFLLFVSGAAQSTLWPNCVRALSEWIPADQIASVFGVMGSVIFAGGIMGTTLAVYLQQLYAPDLRLIFLLPSVISLVMALIVYIFYKTPTEVGVVITSKNETKTTNESSKGDTQGQSKNLNFFQTWRLTLVPELSFTMFGIKLVRYCMYMWLPMYLHQNLSYEKSIAGYMSTSFEVGCVCGSTGLGYVIDRYLGGRMHWGVCVSILGSALSLVFFQLTATSGIMFNFLFLFLAGALQAGPDLIVTGALAVDVGKRENAQSAVCGIVNGFGSVGTIAQGPVIAGVVTHFGWSGSFYAMIALTLLGALAIAKAAIIHGKLEKATPNVEIA